MSGSICNFTVLGDDSYRQSAVKIRDELRALPDSGAAVNAIEAMVKRECA